jgi:hypothetical protein
MRSWFKPEGCPFGLPDHTLVDAKVMTVQLNRNEFIGRGEGSGMYYRLYDEPERRVSDLSDPIQH